MSKTVAKYDPGTEVHGDGWVSLHRNENLFVGPEWTVEAARKLVEQAEIATYPGPASDTLRIALAELYGVGPENIFVGNGSDEVLADLFHLLRQSYDTVHVLDACFKIYLLLAERFGFRLKRLAGDTFNSGHIAAAGTSGLVVVDSPNAITSKRARDEDLAAIAARPGTFLIWDNAYGEFAGDDVPAKIESNRVVVRSFSKFYGLAGLRIGYCVADAALVEELLARKDAFNVNGFAQVMAIEALRRRGAFEQLREQVLVCRKALVERLRQLGFVVQTPGGNFVLAAHPECPAKALQEQLMKRYIAVRHFPGDLTGNHVRITVPPMPVLEHFLAVLDEIVKTWE